jgi:hypothetical protein
MSLKNLTFTEAPQNAGRDPVLSRRKKLVERLTEQISLAKNPDFAPKVKRWVKDEDGNRKQTETTKRITPWWITDLKGEVYLTVKAGLKKVEFEKGKSAIKVGIVSKLEGVLQTLIEATNAGELDSYLSIKQSPFARKEK